MATRQNDKANGKNYLKKWQSNRYGDNNYVQNLNRNAFKVTMERATAGKNRIAKNGIP